ncbi:MAG: HAD family hydrolase [Candidatus Spechtbacterales bacterium]|nr:HAD family hydrolase [Candidatus Spechtbacterales bacterium]
MSKKLLVFDLDDTLMWNSFSYSLAFQDFYNFLTNLWDRRIPYMGSVARLQEDIDASLGTKTNPDTKEPYGFKMERFPTSLVLTYKQLCKDMNQPFMEEAASQIYQIGMRTFREENYRHGMVAGASDVLEFLLKQEHFITLVTKGDERVQWAKIRALNIEGKMEEIHIVDKKTPELFCGIRERIGTPAFDSFSVGNSYFSDIEPAIQAGFHGIYIPCPTWKAEKIPDNYDTSEVTTINNISELKNAIALNDPTEGGKQ